jgi:hypothetical protein
MDLKNAVLAGNLAAQIASLDVLIDEITKAQNEGWLVSAIRGINPAGNNEVAMTIAALDAATSVQAFAFAMGVASAQRGALIVQLSAL